MNILRSLVIWAGLAFWPLCLQPAGRYFCSQRCEDAERFSEVR